MRERKQTNKYFISVEGECEKLYFNHLSRLINECPESKCKVSFVIDINKHPQKFVQKKNIMYNAQYFHIQDKETNSDEDEKKFLSLLEEIKKVKKENSINCILGYCNMCFELWIILHKTSNCYHVNKNEDYLSHINSSFKKSFASMSEYKKEKSFQKILGDITLSDIKSAIKNANIIRVNNEKTKEKSQFNKMIYYKDNPDLNIHEVVKKIIKDCKILL